MLFLLIFFGLLTVVLLVLAGLVLAEFFYVPWEIRDSFRCLDLLLVAIYAVSLLLSGGVFCYALSEYIATHMGYPTSEYRVEKKIVSPGKACTSEADTVYFFKRK